MASGAFEPFDPAPVAPFVQLDQEFPSDTRDACRQRDAAVDLRTDPGHDYFETIPSAAVDAWFSSVGHATVGEARRLSPGPTRPPTATAPSRFPFDVILLLLPMVAISIGVVVLITRIA